MGSSQKTKTNTFLDRTCSPIGCSNWCSISCSARSSPRPFQDFRQSTFEDRLRRLLTPSNASADDARRALRRVGRAGRATALALFGARAARPRVKELLERLMEAMGSWDRGAGS